MTDVLAIAGVILSQLIVWGLVPFVFMLICLSRYDYICLALYALLSGVMSQAILGFCWNHLVGDFAAIPVVLYFVLWGVAIAAACVWRKRTARATKVFRRIDPASYWLLWVWLAAFVVRIIHPLQESALGQSDAYSHLQFLRQVIMDGHVHNRVYPAGFSWIMALPTFVMSLDPYHVARYGGAVWGLLLVGVTFDVFQRKGQVIAARFASGLVAFCPLFYPLLKTGVGMFANQAGLVMLSLMLVAGMKHVVRGRQKWIVATVALALCMTVPMMFISGVLILAVYQVFQFCRPWQDWVKGSLALFVLLLPALGVLVWQSVRLEPAHQAETVRLVTGEQVKLAPQSASAHAAPSPTVQQRDIASFVLPPLVQDYLRVKRMGYGSVYLNIALLVPALLFLGVYIAGHRQKEPLFCLVGLWGIVSGWQTFSGMFQFSGYQRAGWSFLLSCAWLGGGLVQTILTRWARSRCLQAGAYMALGGCFVMSLMLPPVHAHQFSSVEGRIIDEVRSIRAEYRADPPVVVVRAFTGFHGWQGDPVRAAAGLDRREIVTVDDSTDLYSTFAPDRQYVFVLDDEPLNASHFKGLFAKIQPAQVATYIRAQQAFHHYNENVEQLMARIRRERRDETIWVNDGKLRMILFSEVRP